MAWLKCAAMGALMLLNASVVVAQVPPPPMLPGQVDLSQKLVRIFEAKDTAGYGALLAENVQVFEMVS